MARNPDPSRITAELWWFVETCLAMSLGSEYGGTFADKPGYHNTRNNLYSQGRTNDYSVRLDADKLGPGDKTAAFDWTFPDAQAGRYGTIIRYGERVRAAYYARDPRLRGWREVLIQADADGNAEGFDFTSWTERTPDSSHLWHGHFSVLRQYLTDIKIFQAMASILYGETLQTWQAGRSRFGGTGTAGGDVEMFTIEFRQPGGGSSYWVSDGIRRRTLRDWDSYIAVDPEHDGVANFVVTSQTALDNYAGPVDTELGGGGTVDLSAVLAKIDALSAKIDNTEATLVVDAGSAATLTPILRTLVAEVLREGVDNL